METHFIFVAIAMSRSRFCLIYFPSIQKQPNCGKVCSPKGEKRYEIEGCSQEMAMIVMAGQWQKFYTMTTVQVNLCVL